MHSAFNTFKYVDVMVHCIQRCICTPKTHWSSIVLDLVFWSSHLMHRKYCAQQKERPSPKLPRRRKWRAAVEQSRKGFSSAGARRGWAWTASCVSDVASPRQWRKSRRLSVILLPNRNTKSTSAGATRPRRPRPGGSHSTARMNCSFLIRKR